MHLCQEKFMNLMKVVDLFSTWLEKCNEIGHVNKF